MTARGENLTRTIRAALQWAALSGLCREGQVEIAVQEARKLRPDLSDDELLALVETEAGP